jgi:putative transposase
MNAARSASSPRASSPTSGPPPTDPNSHSPWATHRGPLRVNKEIKRRSRVVGIFPNEASVIRLVGAVLADLHDDWIASDRRYLSEASMAKLYPERDDAPTVTAELQSGD